jgi:hypothetical protein
VKRRCWLVNVRCWFRLGQLLDRLYWRLGRDVGGNFCDRQVAYLLDHHPAGPEVNLGEAGIRF